MEFFSFLKQLQPLFPCLFAILQNRFTEQKNRIKLISLKVLDFTKMGMPLNIIFWAIAVWLIPLFWPF